MALNYAQLTTFLVLKVCPTVSAVKHFSTHFACDGKHIFKLHLGLISKLMH